LHFGVPLGFAEKKFDSLRGQIDFELLISVGNLPVEFRPAGAARKSSQSLVQRR